MNIINRNSRFHCLMVCLCLLLTPLAQSEVSQKADSLSRLAKEYVLLGLAVAKSDKTQYLYLGPEPWREQAARDTRSLTELQKDLQQLRQRLNALPAPDNELTLLRKQLLEARVVASMTRASILQGKLPASFDEETRLMFGVILPERSEAHFLALAEELEQIIPGEGDLSERMALFREQFVIPPQRLNIVMNRALEECQRRTSLNLQLPENESVQLNITRDKPWVGFTQYHGDSVSTVHINRDVSVHIERALELGCHEGYPGHHTHATLLQEELINRRGWMEYSFIPLYGPQAVVAEGIASYAPFMAFTDAERTAFEKNVLLPLAGLDVSQSDRYSRYLAIKHELIYAWNETARRYLYGGMSRKDAIAWLMKYGLETHATASQRLDFIAALRTYVLSYNHGMDLVKNYIEREAGDDPQQRWSKFAYLMVTPLTAAELTQ